MKKKYFLIKTLFIGLFAMCSATGLSQTLDFTIDTAIDNGTTITETIILGGVDTYVLTIDHSGNEELDDLGGGDLIFYHSAIDPLAPYTLSVTKNGVPYNFTLNSLGYDTLEAGDISLENNSGATIASRQTYALGAGSINIDNSVNAMDIENFTITPYDTDDLNDFGFHDVNITVLGETLGNTDLDLESSLVVYPNPSNGIFSINYPQADRLVSAELVDLTGKLITNIELNAIQGNQSIDLSSILQSGMYLLRIKTKDAFVVKK